MGYTLSVDDCQPALGNALVDLLKTMPNKHRLTVIEKFEKTHDVQIQMIGLYTWYKVEFQSQEHFMEWYLKWA
jgi:hypothetical protein